MGLSSPFSGAVACGDRQEGNKLGCLCPRRMAPQTQPGVAECRKLPGQLRLGTKSCWPWQGGQSPEASSTLPRCSATLKATVVLRKPRLALPLDASLSAVLGIRDFQCSF